MIDLISLRLLSPADFLFGSTASPACPSLAPAPTLLPAPACRSSSSVESRLILTALANTRGRRIETATKLDIGRNTITRKIQELGLEN